MTEQTASLARSDWAGVCGRRNSSRTVPTPACDGGWRTWCLSITGDRGTGKSSPYRQSVQHKCKRRLATRAYPRSRTYYPASGPSHSQTSSACAWRDRPPTVTAGHVQNSGLGRTVGPRKQRGPRAAGPGNLRGGALAQARQSSGSGGKLVPQKFRCQRNILAADDLRRSPSRRTGSTNALASWISRCIAPEGRKIGISIQPVCMSPESPGSTTSRDQTANPCVTPGYVASACQPSGERRSRSAERRRPRTPTAGGVERALVSKPSGPKL